MPAHPDSRCSQGRRIPSWSLDLLGKLALGTTHEVVNIKGDTTLNLPGGVSLVEPGGLLAQPTNIGHYSADRFAVVPELGLKLGYQVTAHMRLTAGYTFF